MYKIPFEFGNLLACFVPGNKRRARVRGWVNVILFRPFIMSFVRRTYGIKPKSVRFVRQKTLNRIVCVVDEKYYVKIFRNVTVKKLQDFKFLMDFIRTYISVEIPVIFVSKHIPMYVSEKIPGRNVREFDKNLILNNENKIVSQVKNVIQELQKIQISQIPNNERFVFSMQPERSVEKPCERPHQVLAHFDMNETNFLFDDDLNLLGVIDWDTISIAQNPDTDFNIFSKHWTRYKERVQKQDK